MRKVSTLNIYQKGNKLSWTVIRIRQESRNTVKLKTGQNLSIVQFLCGYFSFWSKSEIHRIDIHQMHNSSRQYLKLWLNLRARIWLRFPYQNKLLVNMKQISLFFLCKTANETILHLSSKYANKKLFKLNFKTSFQITLLVLV